MKRLCLCLSLLALSGQCYADDAKIPLPRLDQPAWSRPTILDRTGFDDELEVGKPAKAWIDRIQKQGKRSLPGSIPAVVDSMVVYRSYTDARAASLTKGIGPQGNRWDAGGIMWMTIPLDSAMVDLAMRPRKHQWCERWLREWLQTKSSDLLLGNLSVGTFTTHGRRLYLIDELALMPPPTTQESFRRQIQRFRFSDHNRLD